MTSHLCEWGGNGHVQCPRLAVRVLNEPWGQKRLCARHWEKVKRKI